MSKLSNIRTDANIEDKSIKAARLYEDKRYQEAFKLYLELAEQGYVLSQRFVGWLYFRGEGVQVNVEKAQSWFMKAALAGDQEAMFGIARINMSECNYSEALDWYKKSAEKKYLPSMYWQANFLYKGIAVEKDETKAFDLFNQAANLGHLKSLREYSVMLIKGQCGLSGRVKGIFNFSMLIVLTIVQAFKDPLDEKAII